MKNRSNVNHLLPLAKLAKAKELGAQAELMKLERDIQKIEVQVKELSAQRHRSTTPETARQIDNWWIWRQKTLSRLNQDYARLKAEKLEQSKVTGRYVAEAAVIERLLSESRSQKERRRPTSPDGQYQL